MYIPETIAAIILICLIVQWIRDRVNARVQRQRKAEYKFNDGKSYSIYRGKYLILDNVQSSFLARNFIDTWDKFKDESNNNFTTADRMR